MGFSTLSNHLHYYQYYSYSSSIVNRDIIIKNPGEHIFIPLEAIHRVQNSGNKPVKIVEAQVGSILKETDIVRYQDVYGRVK